MFELSWPRPTLARLVPATTGMMAILFFVKTYAIASALLNPSAQQIEQDNKSLFIKEAYAAPQKNTSQNTSLNSDDRCRHDAACGGQSAAPETSSDNTEQHSLMEEIEARSHELDIQAKTLSERKHTLDAALQALQQHSSGSTAHIVTERGMTLSAEDATRLVSIYEAMKPADAATIFNILDLHVCFALLERMSPRKASAIMEAMSPQRAILATQMLAGRRPQLIPGNRDAG
ncbi:MotE family protein [Kozakia baliensis]|uniref:MotE family protein n=1 Tax=Kozakia baliensis TaxID=153496 RepID=UPI00087AFCBC|nr:hypothetical protein [Kozakia baliensis]AOX20297.1 hypothetical protein A0U90_08310 [Kozakia baliensis]